MGHPQIRCLQRQNQRPLHLSFGIIFLKIQNIGNFLLPLWQLTELASCYHKKIVQNEIRNDSVYLDIWKLNMNATISMDGLWNAIQSMSIRNKKWLADKLLKDIKESEKANSQHEVLTGIEHGFKDIKEGRVHPIEDLWEQL